jgi:hypothetical protein
MLLLQPCPTDREAFTALSLFKLMQVTVVEAVDVIQETVSNVYKNSLKQRSSNSYFWNQ